MTNATSIYSEASTLIVFASCFSYELGLEGATKEYVSWGTIAVIFSIMLFNFIDILYH